MDHDQRFKELLREFLWELLELFLPDLLAKLLAREAAWQSQEVFTNPPLGLVRRVDLLAILQEGTSAEDARERVLHLEAESATSLTEVRKKIGYYYPNLRTKHNLPVTTLAIYLYVGLEGVGWDEYVEEDAEAGAEAESVYRVRWRYVGLPAERYLAGNNWLGVALAALMRIEPERKAWLRAECLRRLTLECQENDYRKLLLINCVEAYLPLEGEQEQTYLQLLRTDLRYQETTQMIQTTYERGVAAAELRGRQEALREMAVRFAAPRCGAATETVLARLQAIQELATLQAVVERAAPATSWVQVLPSDTP